MMSIFFFVVVTFAGAACLALGVFVDDYLRFKEQVVKELGLEKPPPLNLKVYNDKGEFDTTLDV